MRSRDRGLVLIRRRSSGYRHFNNPDERGVDIGRQREWGSVSPGMGNDRVRWRVIFHPNSPELGTLFRGLDSVGYLRNQDCLYPCEIRNCFGRVPSCYPMGAVTTSASSERAFVRSLPTTRRAHSPSNDPISLRRFALLPSICTSSSSSARAIIRKKSNWGFDGITLLLPLSTHVGCPIKLG